MIDWKPTQITLSCLDYWQDNPKLLTKPEAAKLEKSTRKLGRAGVLLVGPDINGRRALYDGHQRANIWRGLYGLDAPIWALESSRPLSDDERRAVSIMTITATGSLDWQKLAGWDFAELQDFGMDGDMLKALNNDANNLKELMRAEQAEPVDAEPQIDRAAELNQKWQVKTGDLWQIGEHRLLCGDSTKREDVERVMGGERARMIFTDPPYNVAYQDNESVESLKARNRRTDGLVVSNDAMTDAEFDAFLVSFLELFPIDAGGVFYLCAPPGRTETQFRNALECVSGLSLRQCIVWVKDVFVFGRQDYHWRHESILYGWKDGAAHYFVDDHTQDTVWEIERPRKSKEHPTMKPVELPERAIKNSSVNGEIVYEPFAGSGTTLVACQNLSRKCRAIEISPNYCAVILERMSAAFPELEIKRISE